MKPMPTLWRASALSFVLAGAALHAGATDLSPVREQRIDHREARQDQRIDQGIASGALTRPEAARLTREEAHIDRLENRVESDGHVTRREALHVERAQDHASRHIYRAKHDRQVRIPR